MRRIVSTERPLRRILSTKSPLRRILSVISSVRKILSAETPNEKDPLFKRFIKKALSTDSQKISRSSYENDPL
jgi:hypothetical protein